MENTKELKVTSLLQPLSTTPCFEAVSENTENVTLFWELFNEVIEKVSNGGNSKQTCDWSCQRFHPG